ncbi:MAG: DUF3060 domain-containing protein [Candidatus Aenigmarchaeota archaeon]|nr:DUF3060 domain-containing protein [Candidatus Aenigmarchaeota archaeon]
MKFNILMCILTIVIVLSGCIDNNEQSAYRYDEPPIHKYEQQENIEVVSIPATPMVATDISTNINGNYKNIDVSGDIIRINGNYNEIKIINADVSQIHLNGNYNTIYYPKDASPLIRENGLENEVKAI